MDEHDRRALAAIRTHSALQRRPGVVVPVADPHEERAVRSVEKLKPWARPLWIGDGVERLVHFFTKTEHIELMHWWWLNGACIGDVINEIERAWQQAADDERYEEWEY
ncbi:hypothetical protein ACWEV3_01075 [Saccharopolyspora sp. NPDC003752]